MCTFGVLGLSFCVSRSTSDNFVRSNSLRCHINVGSVFRLEMIRSRGLHAHVQSESTRLLSSPQRVSNTVTEATRFRSTPTSIPKYPRSVSCHVPHCAIPFQHISHRMKFNDLPQTRFPTKFTRSVNKFLFDKNLEVRPSMSAFKTN